MIIKRIIIRNKKEKLFGLNEIPARPRFLVIFSHGLLSGVKESQRFSIIKQALHKKRIATLGAYFPSHGPRIKENFSLKNCLDTLERTIDYAKNNLSDLPVCLLGVSSGSSLIPCIKRRYFTYIKAVILFSLIPDLSIFSYFQFNKHHYRRWKTYGYSCKHAKKIFSQLVKESLQRKMHLKIKAGLKKMKMPKLIIHGLNDRVTSADKIIKYIDNRSTLFIYSGKQGTHDLKGFPLECATSQCIFWLSKILKKSGEVNNSF